MTNLYTNFDSNQKERISDFFTQNIKVSNIKNEVGKIIGQNYDFPENYPDKLNDTVDLVIKHCETHGLFITSHELIDLLKKYPLKIDSNSFIEELNNLFIDEMTVIIPNNILSLCEDVEHFNFGDAIKCLTSSQIKEQINSIYANKEWLNSALKCLPSTDYSFCIKIKRCTKKSAHILAYKNLNIALSLLKIFSSHINTFYEKPHDVTINGLTLNFSGYSLYKERDLEHNALLPRLKQLNGMIYYGDVVMSITDNLSSSFQILADTTENLQKLEFNEFCDKIFSNKKAIFQNIRKALDFMTKARVENDYSMKFVFFMCSIEALLPDTKNEKEKKIKLIASHVITLTNHREINKEEIDKVITKFYDIRSMVIHSARSNFPTTEHKLLQNITEAICYFYIQKSCSYKNVKSIYDAIEQQEKKASGQAKPLLGC